MNRGRVGKVVRRDVDRLHRSNGATLRVGDPLLQRRELRAERRLVTDAGRDPAEQAGHLGAGLDEPKDIVHEHENVGTLLVSEVLRHGQRGMPDSKPGSRLLVQDRKSVV